MRLALLILFLIQMSLRAAVGDITGLSIPADGWQLWIYTDSLATNKLFSLGFDTNGVATSPKITLTVNSPGFDRTTGATNIKTRLLLGTERVRFPFPSQASPDVTLDGSATLIKVALSEYVGRADVVNAYSVGAAFYDAVGVPNNAAPGGLAVTNLSTQTYKKPVPNPSWPWSERITGSTIPLHMVAAHWSANYVPVACIHNMVTDESGDVVSNLVSTLAFDSSLGTNGLPQFEYYSALNIASLTDGDLLTWRYRVFPEIGEPTDVFDSLTDGTALVSTNTLPQSRPFLKKIGLYGGVAVVGTSAGATPTVYADGTDPTTIPSADYYGTGQAAIAAIQTFNNGTYSHNDAGGGNISYRTGVTTVITANVNPGVMETYLTLQEYPGDTWTLSAAGSQFTGSSDKIKVVGAEMALSGSTTVFLDIEELWLDQMFLNTSGLGPWQLCKVIHLTRNTFGAWAFGIKAFAGQQTGIGIVRQNTGSTMTGPIKAPQVYMGNHFIGTGSSFFVITDDPSWHASLPKPDYQIHWGNFTSGSASGGTLFTLAASFPVTNGFYAVNSAFEGLQNLMSAEVAGGTNETTNCWFFNCLFRGVRNQWFYNLIGTASTARNYCGSINSIFDVQGEATDISTTANANRIGDWPVRWRVGSSGNMDLMLTNMPTHDNPEFRGLNSYRPANSHFTQDAFMGFIDDQAYVGGGGASGNGDYALRSDSRMNDVAYKRRVVMPYDQRRNARGGWSPPGPYSSADPRKGGGFF